MTQYAVKYGVPDPTAALTAVRGSIHADQIHVPGMTASTGVGRVLLMSFPAKDNYEARTRALAVQGAIEAAGQSVESARIRQGHGPFAGPWHDLNED